MFPHLQLDPGLISTGLAAYPVNPSGGVQVLTVTPANPLVLFNLSVSLEWDARSDSQFMGQLRYDLQRTSELLYDWSDGQAALGDITIYHDKQRWEDTRDPVSGKVITRGADIQIYASNRLRPNATQGGISPARQTDPSDETISYEPGQVRMAAVWNRNSDTGGGLGEDWPRTLAHELSHYALFLDDNYVGLDASGQIIPIDGCPGAMSDPYRDDYTEFHPRNADWDARCAMTLSARTTGRADWETIKAFYDRSPAKHGLAFTLNAPASFNANPGPSVLPLAITTIREVAPPAAPTTVDIPTFSLQESASGGRYTPGPGARHPLPPRRGPGYRHGRAHAGPGAGSRRAGRRRALCL